MKTVEPTTHPLRLVILALFLIQRQSGVGCLLHLLPNCTNNSSL